jgi:putative redox protein
VKVTTNWKGKMRFEASHGENTVPMDAPAPMGETSALSPKQLLLAAVSGCTGIDVAARMRKFKQDLRSLRIEANAPKKEGKPSTFGAVTLEYYFEGAVDETIAVEAVVASQTEECGVSAIVASHCPIFYRVYLNVRLVREGQARFFATA